MIWFFMLIFIGVFLWMANLHVVSLARDWPIILIVLGLLSLLGIFRKSRKSRILNDLEHGKITVEQAEDKLKKS
jgi:hypothetical protein